MLRLHVAPEEAGAEDVRSAQFHSSSTGNRATLDAKDDVIEQLEGEVGKLTALLKAKERKITILLNQAEQDKLHLQTANGEKESFERRVRELEVQIDE